jgi:hypothetical protein
MRNLSRNSIYNDSTGFVRIIFNMRTNTTTLEKKTAKSSRTRIICLEV